MYLFVCVGEREKRIRESGRVRESTQTRVCMQSLVKNMRYHPITLFLMLLRQVSKNIWSMVGISKPRDPSLSSSSNTGVMGQTHSVTSIAMCANSEPHACAVKASIF